MRHLIGYLSFLFLIYCVNGNSEMSNIDAKLSHKYQFELFENFKLCSEVYKQESKAVDILFQIKSKLKEHKQNLNIIRDSSKSVISLQNLKNELKIHLQIRHMIIECYKMIKAIYHPQITDYIGSIKALFVLHYAYGINMTDAVLHGNLTYWNFKSLQPRKHQVTSGIISD